MPGKKSAILIVDGERILVDLLTRALSSDDLAAHGATSAADASRLLTLHAPDLVVVDPSIPDGFAFLDHVLFGSPAKVLVLASSKEAGDRAKAAGAQQVVERGKGLDAVVAAIRRTIGVTLVSMNREDAVGVLVADDEEEIRNVLAEFLTERGYNVQMAQNGREAVDGLGEDIDVQVVILDVSMPQMGGLEALRSIMQRENPPGVIMMTAVADREIARQAIELGAFDYILKPFDFASIDASIAACLGHREYQKRPWWRRLTRR